MNDTQHAGAKSPLEIRIDDKTHHGADGVAVPAVRGLALEVERNSMTVLMGPSGCGKTTMLRIIAGLDEDFRGRIALPPGARIGLVFQEPRLLPWRTVRENINLVAGEGFTEEELRLLAESLGIEETLGRYPGELSLGLARRVGIARAYATQPDLLLLDEPFVSLDEPTADRLRRLLLEVWQARPTTAILVTHNAREAIQLADTLVLLAPRPTHVVAEIPITLPHGERTSQAIDAVYADLMPRYPANFGIAA